MRKEYTLAQQFALISLDGLSCHHRSAAKCAAVRGIAAALLLEEILPGEETTELSVPESAGMAEDFREMSEVGMVRDFRKTFEVGMVQDFRKTFESKMAAIKKMKKREMDSVEKDMADLLIADGGMEIVPDLLGCDMNYYTAKITMKSYRSDRDIYLSVVESVRGEILEEGPVTLECACLLWLMRESACLHDIFSIKEQEQIEERMLSLSAEGSFCGGVPGTAGDDGTAGREKSGYPAQVDGRGSNAHPAERGGQDACFGRQEMNDCSVKDDERDAAYISIIWGQEFHKTMDQMVKSCLEGKRKIFKNPYLEGINLRFPFLDRRQAIFVDFVVLGTTVKERRQAVIDFLAENGHHVEEVKNGTETLLRIDNSYYRVWPKTIQVWKVPVQGANLQPVYR